MKVYIDTNVITVLLFGEFSELEKERFAQVSLLFERINKGQVQAILSLYVLQELYIFCRRISLPSEIEKFAWHTFRSLSKHDLGLVGLLSREERLLNKRKFNIRDKSDESHVISAFLNKCAAIVTYDEHFQAVTDQIKIFSPDSLLDELMKNSQNS